MVDYGASDQARDEAIVARFIEAFAANDMAALSATLAADLESGITNADGGVDHVAGREAFLARLAQMDVATVRPDISITQMMTVRPGEVLAMVEIKAAAGGRTLHNFAALLLTLRGGLIERFKMVDAKPAESAAFWSRGADHAPTV